MPIERTNRWGDPEDEEPALYVDEWFPSEKSHQSEEMEVFSRAYVPIGIAIGILLMIASIGILAFALRTEERNATAIVAGVIFGAWSITFLVPYGTLVYYGIKKHVLISRRNRGLPIDMVPEDIDGYSLPLHAVPGVGLTMRSLDAGLKAMPLGMRRSRVITWVALGVYVAATLVWLVTSALWGS